MSDGPPKRQHLSARIGTSASAGPRRPGPVRSAQMARSGPARTQPHSARGTTAPTGSVIQTFQTLLAARWIPQQSFMNLNVCLSISLSS